MTSADAAVLAYFASRAAGYDAAGRRGIWAWQRRREAATILALAGEVAGRSVLDLGCGCGFYARLLAAEGAGPVVAVDAVPAMLDQLDDPNIETIAGDIARIELERRFDRVILAGVLEFAAEPGAVLANARRHLAPQGRIVTLTPPANPAGRIYRAFHHRHGFHIGLFTPVRLAAVVDEAGLRVTASRFVPPYGMVHAMASR